MLGLSKKNGAANRASGAREHARQAGEQVKVAGSQLKLAAGHARPIWSSTKAGAARGANRGRSWAARQLRRLGQALHNDVARKAAERLSSAADRISPSQDRGKGA